MTKKRLFQIIGVIFLSAITLQQVAKYFLDSNTPQAIDELIEQVKNNKALTNKIGGYDSYRFSYNYEKYDMGEDSPFEIIIFGDTAGVKFIGKLRKQGEVSRIVEVDTVFKSY